MDLNQISAYLQNLLLNSDGEMKEAPVSQHDDPKPPPFQAPYQSSDSPTLVAGGGTSLAHQNPKKEAGAPLTSDISSKPIPNGKKFSWFGQSKRKTKQLDSVNSVKTIKSTFSHLSMLNRRKRFKAGKSKGGASKISTLLRKTRTKKGGTSVAKSLFSMRSKLTSRSKKNRGLKKLSEDVKMAINLLWSKRYGEKALMTDEDFHSVPSAIRLKHIERPATHVANGGGYTGFQGCCFADSVMEVLTGPSLINYSPSLMDNPISLATTWSDPYVSDVSLNVHKEARFDDNIDSSTLVVCGAKKSGTNYSARNVDKQATYADQGTLDGLGAESGTNYSASYIGKQVTYDDQGTFYGTVASIATERDGNWFEKGVTKLVDDSLDIILGKDLKSATKKMHSAGNTTTGNEASLRTLSPNPSSWKAVVDKETGRTYYCRVTRETTWTKPKDLALEASRSPMGCKELKFDDREAVPNAVDNTAGNESSPSGELKLDDKDAVPNAVDNAAGSELKLDHREAVPNAIDSAAGNESPPSGELKLDDREAVRNIVVNKAGNESSPSGELKLDDREAVPSAVVNKAGNEASPSVELKLDDEDAVPNAIDNTAGNESPPRTLPQKPVWKAVVDKETGRTYYFHRVTREATWTKPKDLALNASRSPMGCKELKFDDGEAVSKALVKTAGNEASPITSPQNPSWRAVVDTETGRTYYFHRETRQTTWTKPEDFVESKKPTFYLRKTRHEVEVSKSNIVEVAGTESSAQSTEVVSNEIATQSTGPLDTSWDEDIHILNIVRCTSFDSSEALEVQVPKTIVGSSSVSAYSEASPISESSSDSTKPKWKLLRWRRNTSSPRKETDKEEPEAPKPMCIEVVTKDNENQEPDKLSSRLLAEVEKRIDPTTEEDYSYTSGFEEQNGDENDSFIYINEWEFEQVLDPEK
jgi:hypothetical protein